MQNILESQVTDLTNLADSPIAMAGPYHAMNGQGSHRQSSSAESPVNDNGKRKGEDGQNGSSQQRAKRNRYISIACNECKRRKIKCNGNTPCQRCGNLNLECQYAPNCCANGFKDSDEFKHMNAQISSLQEQVDNLYASMSALRAGDLMALSQTQVAVQQASPTSTYRSIPKHPRFQGPTSSAFSFDVAKSTLQNMGYPGLVEGGDGAINTADDTPMGSPPLRPISLREPTSKSTRDPLWSLTKDEAVRLCRVYEEEMGLMYPFLDIEDIIQHATMLYRFLEAASKSGLASEANATPKGIHDDKSNLLKMVMACAAVVEGNGQSEISTRLYESVRPSLDELMHEEAVEQKALSLMTLVAMWHFHSDEEALAWRTIGQVARMCIELGWHRRTALYKAFPEDVERGNALKLFWSVYVLDRRWSFGTGLPFVIQDGDIDPLLPEPEVSIPYLSVMISYSRIGSRVWKSVAAFDPTATPGIKREDIGYLDYQILQWQKSVPMELQLPTTNAPQTSSRAIHRLQILLYLRANQMRILIYRPVLHSANSIMENLSYAQTVVELAKDTIRALTHLNQTTDIYRAQQVCFNYFLISALAVIFLASCHAPVQFSSSSRDEFYMALDLIKGFSSKSYVSKRLWKTIKGLKEVGPKLGLSPELSSAPNAEDPHSSAALAMAGLAGHEISGLNSFAVGAPMGNSPINGFQMSHEMTNLFEAALGTASGLNGNGTYVGSGLQDIDQSDVTGANVFGGEDELYRQLRDLF